MSDAISPNSSVNQFGQPIGRALPQWRAATLPKRETLTGTSCRLEPLEADRHARALFEAYQLDAEGRNWTYLAYGPFTNFETYRAWMVQTETSKDPLFFAIVDQATGQAVGVAAYLRIDPANGVIEVGHLSFSPLLQRNRAATEAMYLMMKNAFALGYRRYEWKCDALNAPSRRAAQRFGFTFEGIFRQATVYKGRSRDTAWFSIIDSEWSALNAAYLRWLSPENFDERQQQRKTLQDCR